MVILSPGMWTAWRRSDRWEEQGADWLLEVEPPLEMMPLLVTKGSVALDGISLTVAEVLEQSFRVWVIPHTRKVTNLKNRKTGMS